MDRNQELKESIRKIKEDKKNCVICGTLIERRWTDQDSVWNQRKYCGGRCISRAYRLKNIDKLILKYKRERNQRGRKAKDDEELWQAFQKGFLK